MAPLPWAVHISDGVLSTPWVVGGFAGTAVLMLTACRRVRDEEVPRIALLTAAFFVASLIHLRAGPTSVHLLLNGLVGVVLGRRAGLAIPVGLLLQAVLLGHGGVSALGVNACVMTLPALAAGGLFRVVQSPLVRHPASRSALVVLSTLAWVLCLVFSVSLLVTNRVSGLDRLDPAAAVRVTLHPATLAAAVACGLGVARVERREAGAPEFALGLALGVLSVLATTALNAAVLLWGGAEDWHTVALLVFVAHLPIAALEGLALGATVSFLARVKPELLGLVPYRRYEVLPQRGLTPASPTNGVAASREKPWRVKLPGALVLAVLAGLAAPSAARAHRLDAEYRVLPDGRVRVESWFDLTGDSPEGAAVQVFRGDGQLVTEGKVDAQGLFTFHPGGSGPLRVVVSAGAGHRKELQITSAGLERPPQSAPSTETAQERSLPSEAPTFADRSPRVTGKDVLAGIGFLLALAAFVMSLRNARALREMKRDR
jgi:cobalt/nickel transport system permease protein